MQKCLSACPVSSELLSTQRDTSTPPSELHTPLTKAAQDKGLLIFKTGTKRYTDTTIIQALYRTGIITNGN